MVYDLPVVDEKIKPHQVTALHLICSLAFIGTGAIISVYNYTIPRVGNALLAAGILLAAVTIVKNKWVISKKINLSIRVIELLIALGIAVLSITQHWKFPAGIFGVLSVAIAFAIYWERGAGSTLFVHIDSEGIKLPVTSRKRFLPWTEVEEVVIRFGTLSINCPDNRLFQWDISGAIIDNEIFEAYCAAQVEENRSERVSDDW